MHCSGRAGANAAAEIVQTAAVLAASQASVPISTQVASAGIRQIVVAIQEVGVRGIATTDGCIRRSRINTAVGCNTVGVERAVCRGVGRRPAVNWFGGVADKVGCATVGRQVGLDIPRSGYTGSDCSCLLPGAPTAVTAVAASGKVTLSWTAPSGGAASYNILRSTTKGSGYTSIGTATTTSFVNSGLTNGVQYYYVVQASNGASCNSVNSREKVCGGGIYCDDFESGTAPNWTVSNGTFAASLSSNNYVYKQTQTGSTTAGRYAYKASSTANYTVQAAVRVTQFGDTTSSSRAGVAARYSNSTTSYTFGLAGNNTLTLQKGYATAITNCAAIAFTVSLNTWYTLKIVVSGTSIKTYVNGTLKHSCTDSTITAANSAALFTGSGGTPGTLADFDDVFIY